MARVALFLIILSLFSSMWPNGSGDGGEEQDRPMQNTIGRLDIGFHGF